MFAEIAVCAILGAVTLAALGLLVYGALLGRIKIAERQLNLEQLARQAQLEQGTSWAVRAELLKGGAEVPSPGVTRPAIPANVTPRPARRDHAA